MSAPLIMNSIDAAVDHVLDTIPGDIVLGIPLGVGKANPTRNLRVITALSLEKPVGKSELERHFLAPLVERVFGDYPDLEYVKDLRGAGLPPNIEVCEVFMKTGDYLGNEAAQQSYMSTNYTHIARDMESRGMNVMAQSIAKVSRADYVIGLHASRLVCDGHHCSSNLHDDSAFVVCANTCWARAIFTNVCEPCRLKSWQKST